MLALIDQKRAVDKYNVPCDMLESTYYDFFLANDIQICPVPNLEKPYIENYLALSWPSTINGVILSGGNNVGDTEVGSISLVRDITTRALLEKAMTYNIPVLGICRGMQFINIFFGGSIIRDLKTKGLDGHGEGRRHKVSITDEVLREFLAMESCEVNSYHNQGLTMEHLSPKLNPFLISEDGVVEGIYHPTAPIAAIQFHPEREKKPNVLIQALIEAFKNHKFYWADRASDSTRKTS